MASLVVFSLVSKLLSQLRTAGWESRAAGSMRTVAKWTRHKKTAVCQGGVCKRKQGVTDRCGSSLFGRHPRLSKTNHRHRANPERDAVSHSVGRSCLYRIARCDASRRDVSDYTGHCSENVHRLADITGTSTSSRHEKCLITNVEKSVLPTSIGYWFDSVTVGYTQCRVCACIALCRCDNFRASGGIQNSLSQKEPPWKFKVQAFIASIYTLRRN